MVGGVLGMMLLALMMAAKEADERIMGRKEEGSPGECFWCGERMMKTSNGTHVCPACGRRYRGREEE
jgi:predicted RNA-binding Zn-ribbon protein involved in translation (DUF1610 family)